MSATGRDFEGLRAVVTGGSSGIGAATIELLMARGATVGSIDLQPTSLPVAQVVADVADADATAAAVAELAATLGGIDVLVCDAGIGAIGTVETTDLDTFRRVMDVNVFGVVHTCRAALPYLRQSAHPVIVNVSSIVAVGGFLRRAAYSASKGAVQALTMAMATDHVAEGIRVNCVLPGTADTPWVDRLLSTSSDPVTERADMEARQPIGRLVTAEEIAHAIAYLASPLSGSTTATGLAVDGGAIGIAGRKAAPASR